MLHLEKRYDLNNENSIRKTLTAVAHQNQYHSIRDYLNHLGWNGTEHIRFALYHFLGMEISEYTYEVMKLFLLGAIDRAFKPGCKFERMLDLVGDRKTANFVRKEIQKQIDDGIDYGTGQVTVIELLEKYISLKRSVRYNIRIGYQFVLKLVKKEVFVYRKISTIKVSEAKQWFAKLQKDGRGYSTITSVRGVVKPEFQITCDEDAVKKNPFVFKLTEVMVNDSTPRAALKEERLAIWITFIEKDKTYFKSYDEFVVLLETGMRVSEFCGLTRKERDFKNRRIRADHQLVRECGGKYYVEETKTSSGCRFLSMTAAVYDSQKKMLERRPEAKMEPMVDGYSGFIMMDKNGNPKVALHIESEMQWGMKKYKKLHPDCPLLHITPHVFRHTFCTNYANEGMDIRKLQYLMGHSDVGVTFNVYTHASYAHVAEQLLYPVSLCDSESSKDGTEAALPDADRRFLQEDYHHERCIRTVLQ